VLSCKKDLVFGFASQSLMEILLFFYFEIEEFLLERVCELFVTGEAGDRLLVIDEDILSDAVVADVAYFAAGFKSFVPGIVDVGDHFAVQKIVMHDGVGLLAFFQQIGNVEIGIHFCDVVPAVPDDLDVFGEIDLQAAEEFFYFILFVAVFAPAVEIDGEGDGEDDDEDLDDDLS